MQFIQIFFLSCWTNDVEEFPKVTWIIFSTELSTQIFDCCPRNFLIQEEKIGNVVSTSHWIRPVLTATFIKNNLFCNIISPW